MTVAIPYWPNRRLVVGAHTIRLMEPKLAIHSNITPGKLAGESKHILMLDYDNMTMERVQENLDDAGIFNYFLFTTKKGFHVIDTTKQSWLSMRVGQLFAKDDDMHHRMTERFGRAALALHTPVKLKQVGKPEPLSQSIPHYMFYLNWYTTNGDMEVARKQLSVGDIAFRFYCKHSFGREVF